MRLKNPSLLSVGNLCTLAFLALPGLSWAHAVVYPARSDPGAYER